MDQPAKPIPDKVVNVIIGGSEISCISYSIARRHARIYVNPKKSSFQPLASVHIDQIINFVNNEAPGLIKPHNDALVINLLIANCMIKRILINDGSSTNVLFMSVLKEMNIYKSNIRCCSIVLIGIRGEQKFTIEDITLAVYVGRVNLNVTFEMLDNPSANNMILGRPWIHKMRAVPYTFHQVVRFPTR